MTHRYFRLFILKVLLLLYTKTTFTSGAADELKLNETITPGKDCYRTCKPGDLKICHFKFVMEHYQAMGVACDKCAQGVIKDCFNIHCLPIDGVERGVLSINRQIPGPPILVCENDWIVVDVVNQMMGTTTALHWHGLHMKNTPWMDGVPFITQCPINFASEFRYVMQATEAGTQFYHSHAGHHKLNGHHGPLIVRKAIEQDPHKTLYDFDLHEHLITISDWQHYHAEMFTPGLPTKAPGIAPTNIVINGKGIYKTETEGTKTPVEVYKVQRNKAYRFRMINAGCHDCPIEIRIQDHNMRVIATDSHDVQSIEIDTLVTASGERYDLVLNATQTAGTYCIHIRYTGECACPSCQQYALLVYTDKTDHKVSTDEYVKYSEEASKCYESNIISKVKLNDPKTICNDNDETEICVGELSSIKVDESLVNDTPDHRFYLGININEATVEDLFQEGKYESFMNPDGANIEQMSLNNITFVYPSFSALTQTEELSEDMFCDADHLPPKCNKDHICHCTHRLKIKLGSIVEIVVIDETGEQAENHPFHIHGHAFYVKELGQITDQPLSINSFKSLESTNSLPTSPENHQPVLKDTVSIPFYGYAILRFRADNPGLWLFHCHYEYHVLAGMNLVLQVGEYADFKKPPKNFPKCGSFATDIMSIINNTL